MASQDKTDVKSIKNTNVPKSKRKQDKSAASIANLFSQIPPNTLPFLNENHIFVKYNSGKPTLFCHACCLTLKTVPQAIHHTSQPVHKDSVIAKRTYHVLLHLPPITSAHKSALNAVLLQATKGVCLNVEEHRRRRDFAESVAVALEVRIPGLQVRCVGSVISGISLLDSDVNLDAYIASVNGIDNDCRLSYIVGRRGSEDEMLGLVTDAAEADKTSVQSSTFLDPYKPGFGSLLPEILLVLKSVVQNSDVQPTVDTEVAQFPKINTLLQCSVDNFHLTFNDPNGIIYRITVGNPLGHHFASLVKTYLSIDRRARKLMILFRKFCKMASLDLRESNTFQPPALPIMVIFYLQHTSPPILPNLQEIASQNSQTLPAEAIEKVVTSDGNLSFLKDLTHLPKFFPSTSRIDRDCPTPTANATDTNYLADLWLGFLRFYLFEFQSRTCIVSISSSTPIPKSSFKHCSSLLFVQDPFNPNYSLTKNLVQNTYDYINSQLSSAYAYFGVPRLARTGRPLFTDVEVEVVSESEIPKNEDSSKRKKTRNVSKQISLLSSMDSTASFESHANKVIALLAEEFLENSTRTLNIASDCPLSTVNISSRLLSLRDLVPRIFKLCFSEICNKESVDGLVDVCMDKFQHTSKKCDYVNRDVSLTEATAIVELFSVSLWKELFKVYIYRGRNLTTEKRLARVSVKIFRETIRKTSVSSVDTVIPNSTESSNVLWNIEHMEVVGNSGEVEKELLPEIKMEASSHSNSLSGMEDSPDSNTQSAFWENLEDENGCDVSKVTLDEEGDGVCTEDAGGVIDLNLSAERTDHLTEISPDEIEFLNTEHSGIDIDTSAVEIDSEMNVNESEANSLLEETNEEVDSSFEDSNKIPTKSRHAWKAYIQPTSHSLQLLDSSKPDFYNSEEVEKLCEDDYSFPFIAKGHATQGKQYMRASVLGLAFPDEPSTLLAHFSPPPPICNLCGTIGHKSESCSSSPDESVSMASWKSRQKKLPKVVCPDHLRELSACLEELCRYHTSEDNNKFREVFVRKLNNLFKTKFPTVQLEMFGSCANGFGTTQSDMDICVFFPPGTPEAKQLSDEHNRITIIKSFKQLLNHGSMSLGISTVHAVLQAKVPIVKFVVEHRFEADLSFSNYLATKNTRMLKTYNDLDPRLRVLNTALKTIIKSCKIAKSNAGGISSYAFSILLIHFMQQKGFLPVLQELYEGTDRPIIMAGAWNIWYQNDISVIRKLWQPPSNDLSVAELWLGFFRYYLFEFDRERYIVTINQKALLERLAKLWNSLLAIEDPFNLRHNLTASVQRKILSHTLNSFYDVLLHHSTFLRGNLEPNLWKFSLFSPHKICQRGESHERIPDQGDRYKSPSCSESNPQQRQRNNYSAPLEVDKSIHRGIGQQDEMQTSSKRLISENRNNFAAERDNFVSPGKSFDKPQQSSLSNYGNSSHFRKLNHMDETIFSPKKDLNSFQRNAHDFPRGTFVENHRNYLLIKPSSFPTNIRNQMRFRENFPINNGMRSPANRQLQHQIRGSGGFSPRKNLNSSENSNLNVQWNRLPPGQHIQPPSPNMFFPNSMHRKSGGHRNLDSCPDTAFSDPAILFAQNSTRFHGHSVRQRGPRNY